MPLKDISNFWRTLEMPLINCEINLIFTWSEGCVTSPAARAVKLKITDTVVTLSTQDNTKLLQQLKSTKIINRSTKPIFRFLN